ncbi:hypothetical protein A0H81_14090 [Grifola frondosa]|uniref:Uncharacterized protein n=1 Tax=Grifola frondosa TaxID=5627 RepID=A0A1C7LMM0_GRIFR|nr:hypothetical protein A0H81_14090 [Grifola frondosa]
MHSEDVSDGKTICLPSSLRSWRDIDAFKDPEWWQPWELLRPFFKERGYDLYRHRDGGLVSISNGTASPDLDSFGLYGIRTEEFYSYFGRVSAVYFGLQNFCRSYMLVCSTLGCWSMNRDVVIKLVPKGSEGLREFEILRLLSSEPLRSDPANATVPALEFIEYDDCRFVVMPYCDGCDDDPFLNQSEYLDFAEQLLTVRRSIFLFYTLTTTPHCVLSFLHANRFAQLDISFEKF